MSFNYVSVTMVNADQLVWFVLCPLNFLADQADYGGAAAAWVAGKTGHRL